MGIIRNHYVGRTFIEPSDHVRHLGVKLKHNGNRAVLEGKRVILVDDSIVRGTTSKKIVNMVREAGAAQVHMRIASPPTTHSCFYGVDTPTRDQLLAANHTIEAMAKLIGADSLAVHVTIDGMYKAVADVAPQPPTPRNSATPASRAITPSRSPTAFPNERGRKICSPGILGSVAMEKKRGQRGRASS